MKSDAGIPCSTCLLWDKEKKRFYCNPNKCKKLANWLLKHTRERENDPQKETVQYVV